MQREPNADQQVIADFGTEWTRFDQARLSGVERETIFNSYFAVFPWEKLGSEAVGFDLGCGSGRWAALVAPRVGHLHCIDPSDAIEIARRNLRETPNCSFHRAAVDAIPLPDESMDFGYSIGVLHHVPDTQQGIAACVRKLKHGAPLLLYLYYAFDNRPAWFRLVWRISDGIRRVISTLPAPLKYALSQAIAAGVYFPMGRTAKLLERAGMNADGIPLSAYRDKSFYTMRTDAFDRFGTRLEQRFTRMEIQTMMEAAGLEDVRFSSALPFWCAVGAKK